MFRNDTTRFNASEIEIDLYFLIARFLSAGPCRDAAEVLIKSIEDHGLLHRHVYWDGADRRKSFQETILANNNIAPDHLLQLCRSVVSLLNETMPPPVIGRPSLLGTGRYSVLRTRENVAKTSWTFRNYAVDIANKPLVPPHNYSPQNWELAIRGRELGGSKYISLLKPVQTLYGKMQLHRRILGHLSSVYCVLFDRTGSRIFTGSDDCLVKIWSSQDGRLIMTLRGHQSEICDMDVSYENTILATGSCNKEIRIWDLCSAKPIAILQGHNAMITSIEFSSVVQGDTRFLISTGRDGNVCFWQWNVSTQEFNRHPIKFQERNRPGVAMNCSSWSGGGRFVAVGGSDNLVHIYHIPLETLGSFIEPLAIAEQDDHADDVDSLWFAHSGMRFITGSKDGTARVWTYEHMAWTSYVLDVTQSIGSAAEPTQPIRDRSPPLTRGQAAANSLPKVRVIMVAWDCCDENVMTSLTDYTIKVWNSRTKKLVSVLKAHTDEAYCLEPHPTDKRIFLSAGHDGNVFLWDVTCGKVIMKFYNLLEGQGHGAVFDAKFSPEGSTIACTDSHGHLILFGLGSDHRYLKMPEQQFFHTDYRPLIRDQHGYVLDEQTQQAPHLMPPPFLVDVEGNPYPPHVQRLVPGRERCHDMQLIPSLVTGENGMPEVLPLETDQEVYPEDEIPQSSGDQSNIAAREQIQPTGSELPAADNGFVPLASPSRSSAVGLRREGDVAGVRQMHSNAPRSQVASAADIMALTKRVITPQFSKEESLCRDKERIQKGTYELNWYKKERRNRRLSSHRRKSTETLNHGTASRSKTSEVARSLQRRAKANLRTILREEEEEESEEETQEVTQSRRRELYRRGGHMHRYSTRSTAPRRRDRVISTESPNEINQTEEESHSSDSASETSSNVFTSDDNFSQKAMIVRRSNRNRVRLKRDNFLEEEDAEMIDIETTSPDHTASSAFSPNMNVKKKFGAVKRNGQLPRTRHNRRLASNFSWKPNDNDGVFSDEEWDRKQGDRNSDSSATEDQPSTSTKKLVKTKVQLSKVTFYSKRKKFKEFNKKKEIPFKLVVGQPPPKMYLPPDWIKIEEPWHFPFVPQIGDEVVYLRQGHESYVQKVIQEKIWDINESKVCFNKMQLGVVEFCRVIDVTYIIGPPTLCEIRFRPIMRKVSVGEKSNDFVFKYHDMINVVDFLVLRQKYEASMANDWKASDRFRSIIDHRWWYGVIVERMPHDSAYPNSPFQSLSVVWDSEDTEKLSPWDLEVIPDNLRSISPVHTRSHVQRTPSEPHPSNQDPIDIEELQQVMAFTPKPGDWGGVDPADTLHSDSSEDDESCGMEEVYHKECNRMKRGIEQLLSHDGFKPFKAPVNMCSYPTYPCYVAYPTDLSTILRRVTNRFYRQSAALCWEISLLESNARAFNEPNTSIVREAKLLTQLLLKFVNSRNCHDILKLHEELRVKERLEASSTEEESSSAHEEVNVEPASRRSRRRKTRRAKVCSSSDEEEVHVKEEIPDVNAWVQECNKLIDDAMEVEDSRPFREPVDEECYPNYREFVDVPMDLGTIRSRLRSDGYRNPEEFRKDVSLIFSNAKVFNNKKSKVFGMSIRLSGMVMTKIDKEIIPRWEKAVADDGKRMRRSCKAKERFSDVLRRSSRRRKYVRANLNDSIQTMTDGTPGRSRNLSNELPANSVPSTGESSDELRDRVRVVNTRKHALAKEGPGHHRSSRTAAATSRIAQKACVRLPTMSSERKASLSSNNDCSDGSANESSQPIFTNSEYTSSDNNSEENGEKSLPVAKYEEATAKGCQEEKDNSQVIHTQSGRISKRRRSSVDDYRSDNEIDNPEPLPHKKRKKQIETDSERNENSSNSEDDSKCGESSDPEQDETPSEDDNDSDFLSPKTKKKPAVVRRARSSGRLNGHSKRREYARPPSFGKQKPTPVKISPRNLRTTRGRRPRYYDCDEDDELDDKQCSDDLGMSSRGRKRRMSYKAKEARVF